jgi:hypothetical protein
MPFNVASLDFLPRTVLTGATTAIESRYYSQITVITDAACTATVIRVDTEPDNPTPGTIPATPGAPVVTGVNQFTVAPSTLYVQAVDWPFYVITAAGGTCRIALV